MLITRLSLVLAVLCASSTFLIRPRRTFAGGFRATDVSESWKLSLSLSLSLPLRFLEYCGKFPRLSSLLRNDSGKFERKVEQVGPIFSEAVTPPCISSAFWQFADSRVPNYRQPRAFGYDECQTSPDTSWKRRNDFILINYVRGGKPKRNSFKKVPGRSALFSANKFLFISLRVPRMFLRLFFTGWRACPSLGLFCRARACACAYVT